MTPSEFRNLLPPRARDLSDEEAARIQAKLDTAVSALFEWWLKKRNRERRNTDSREPHPMR